MRNLKKILALVLALVMSLSLMATASATESTAAANDYTLATNVLHGLDVVIGDEGGIRADQPITRAEVATLVYRIHTADVADNKADLYRDLTAFTDLDPVKAWALGYIGYAYNAEIVKGNGDNTFSPTGNVTGYEALAMALRAIGYGKNHEFEGAEWQINTAAWGRREGLLDGVSALDQTRLDEAASRGLVFQILFNAIQHEDMGKSYTTTDLYAGLGDTMANRLGLEKVTGVVIANEWAALDDTKPRDEGETKVKVADGSTRTLNDWSTDDYRTGLEEIGLSYDLYIRDKVTVLDKALSDSNNVWDNEGEAKKVSDSKINADDAEYFINFDKGTKTYSEWLIRYVLEVGGYDEDGNWVAVDWYKAGNAWYEYLSGLDNASWAYDIADTAKVEPLSVTVTIRPGDEITNTDQAIMEEIFYSADRRENKYVGEYWYWVRGEVYAGTSSLKDLSDQITWKSFVDDYLKAEKAPFDSVAKGNWLRVIDNDDDGKADYVLRTDYVLDQVVEIKNDKTYFMGLNIDDWTPVYVGGYTPNVEDIVLYTCIDGNAYTAKAVSASVSFVSVDYKNATATGSDGKVWNQSGIENLTKMPQVLTAVDEKTDYTVYEDYYGNVRAYSGKVNYALLTEVYPTNGMNTAWVVNRALTAEVMRVGDTAVQEYNVLNSYYSNGGNDGSANCFYTTPGWKYPGITDVEGSAGEFNYLQPATHMLGVPSRVSSVPFVFENRGDGYTNYSWTNVAKYVMGENGISLYTAASRNNADTRAASDYIRLDPGQSITKTNPLYEIDDLVYNNDYTTAQQKYVRAVDSTVFFVVAVNSNGVRTIRQYTGYNNVPELNNSAANVNDVRAMYAVARNTASDTDSQNYWVADVIVIEVENFEQVYESISLIYSNDTKTSGDIKYLQALDSELGKIGIVPSNVEIWQNQYTAWGFYGLMNVKAIEGEENLYSANIYPIYDHSGETVMGRYERNIYNTYGIYYGQVRSLLAEDSLSDYISVDVLDQYGNVVDTHEIRLPKTKDAYKITEDSNIVKDYYNTASELLLKGAAADNQLNEGDKIFWVETASASIRNTVGFIVDISKKDTPDFLDGTESYYVAKCQWNGGENSDIAWNYEAIIGKGVNETLARMSERDGFVLTEYNLYLNGELQPSVYSGILSDNLWHIRYNLPALQAGDVLSVSVVRNGNIASELVLNSADRGVVTGRTGVSIHRNNEDAINAWYFARPAVLKDQKIVETVFAVNTNAPSVINYPAFMVQVDDEDIKTGTTPVVPPEKDEVTVTFDADGAEVTVKDHTLTESAVTVEQGTELEVTATLTGENDTLKIGTEEVVTENGSYTWTVTADVDKTVVVRGSKAGTETTGIPVKYEGVPVTGGVTVVPDDGTLTIGVDIPNPADDNLAGMVEGKLGVWVYKNEFAEENEIKADGSVYTIPADATQVIVFYGNDTTDTPDEPGDTENPGNPGSTEGWDPVTPLSSAVSVSGRAAGIQTLDLPTATFTFWYFVDSDHDITTATVFNNGVTTQAGEPKAATEDEITAVCAKNASIKANLDKALETDAEGKVGYVTFTYLTDDHTVTPDVRTKNNEVEAPEEPIAIESLPYRAVKGSGVDNTYNFYGWGTEYLTLTPDQVKQAIKVAEEDEITAASKKPVTVELIENNTKAVVTYKDGTTEPYFIKQTGSFSVETTGNLYQVKYNGAVVGYFLSTETANIGTSYKTGYLIEKGEYEAAASTSLTKGLVVTENTDTNFEYTGKATTAAVKADVEYVDAVQLDMCGKDWYFYYKVWDASAGKYGEEIVPSGSANRYLTIPTGTKISLSGKANATIAPALTKGVTYVLSIDGVPVAEKVGEGTTATFEITAEKSGTFDLAEAIEVRINGVSKGKFVDGGRVDVDFEDETKLLMASGSGGKFTQYWNLATGTLEVDDGAIVLSGISSFINDGTLDLWECAAIKWDGGKTAEVSVNGVATAGINFDQYNYMYVAKGAQVTFKASTAEKYPVLTIVDPNAPAGADPVVEYLGTVNEWDIAKETVTIGGDKAPLNTQITVGEVTSVLKMTVTLKNFYNGQGGTGKEVTLIQAPSPYNEVGYKACNTVTVVSADGRPVTDEDTLKTGGTYRVTIEGIEAADNTYTLRDIKSAKITMHPDTATNYAIESVDYDAESGTATIVLIATML